MHYKKSLNAVMGLLILVFSLSSLAATAIPLDKVVAIVNKQVITQSQLNAAVAVLAKQMQAANVALPSADEMRHKVLEQLILNDIQLQLAERNNIKVTDAQLNDAIAKIAAQNRLTVAQLQQEVAREGLSIAQFRKQIREQLIISQLQQRAIAANITVSDQEVRDYLRTAPKQTATASAYHVQDILIPLPDSPTPTQVSAAQQRAQVILKQVRKGVDFSQVVAAQTNEQPALQGGDLGWRSLADLPDIFESKVAAMKPGAIAGPIKAPNGFHIIKLVAVQGGAKQPQTDKDVRELIFQRKFQNQVQIWLQQLRNSAYVKIML